MEKKESIRKKFFLIRKKKYFQVEVSFFYPLIDLLKKKIKDKKINISIYYPNSFEVNTLKIFEINFFKKCNFLLPIIEKNNSINFYKWNINEILNINKYGIPEPEKTKKKTPSVILIPLLAFDGLKNRLGYGGGFYDKFLQKYIKINKKILTIGIAFSFQKYKKLPTNSQDVKLKYIITEKGII
tara:strand:- start:7038 stop:7589 length:552 start_codon:yes stop_codon:yes gene_type:complete